MFWLYGHVFTFTHIQAPLWQKNELTRPFGDPPKTVWSIHHYGYAGMVRRTAATTGQVRLYEVDEAGRRLGEYVKDASEPSGRRAVQEFVYLDNWRIVGLVDYAPGGGSSLMAVLSDPITGTPRQVMDSSGDIRWDWDSKEAFGNQAPDQAPTSGKASLVFDARFPGQWYDQASGLFHNNWRDYWASAGRYTQVDPIGLAGGANPYAYAGGNPVEAIDPLGLKVVFTGDHGDLAEAKISRARNKSSYLDNLMKVLELSNRTYKINASTSHPTNQYSYGLKEVAWNPNLAPECISTSPKDWYKNGGMYQMLPTDGLYHEIGHAYRHEMSLINRTPIPGQFIEERENLIHERVVIDQLYDGQRRGRNILEYYLGF